MISYRDMAWCVSDPHRPGCEYPLTDQVREDARKWWLSIGVGDPPIATARLCNPWVQIGRHLVNPLITIINCTVNGQPLGDIVPRSACGLELDRWQDGDIEPSPFDPETLCRNCARTTIAKELTGGET